MVGKLRIAHITATFPPYQGGTGNVCYYNARELARLGHEVHVFTAVLEGSPAIEQIDGFTIHRLLPFFRMGNAPFLPDLLRIKNFDLIHLHYPFIFGAEMIWLVSRLRRIPYLITYHNDLLSDGIRGRLFTPYLTISSRLVFGGAARLGVVSFDHAANSRPAPLFRRRLDDVVAIPNGVDITLFRPRLNGLAVRHQLGIPSDARVILFVGALDRAHGFKGLDHLLEAFSLIKDRQSFLLVVGDGDLRPHFEICAAESGVSDRTVFTGSIPNKDLPSYYAVADVVVLPSYPPESFGMVLIEAMACGKPVIAHDIPGVRTVVTDGEDGLLLQPGTDGQLARVVTDLLSQTDRRHQMGRKGRAKVEAQFSWPRLAVKLNAIYERALIQTESLIRQKEGTM